MHISSCYMIFSKVYIDKWIRVWEMISAELGLKFVSVGSAKDFFLNIIYRLLTANKCHVMISIWIIN